MPQEMQEKLNFMPSTLFFEMAPYLIFIVVSQAMFPANFVLSSQSAQFYQKFDTSAGL